MVAFRGDAGETLAKIGVCSKHLPSNVEGHRLFQMTRPPGREGEAKVSRGATRETLTNLNGHGGLEASSAPGLTSENARIRMAMELLTFATSLAPRCSW